MWVFGELRFFGDLSRFSIRNLGAGKHNRNFGYSETVQKECETIKDSERWIVMGGREGEKETSERRYKKIKEGAR